MEPISNSDEDHLYSSLSQVLAAIPVRCLCTVYRILVLVVLLVSLSACVGSPDDLLAYIQPEWAMDDGAMV